MTLTLQDIERVHRSAPSTSGAYRDVYFLDDDTILKIENDDPVSNLAEYENYLRLKPMDDVEVGGRLVNFRFPKTELVFDNYLLCERIHFPLGADVFPCNCDYDDRREEWYALPYDEMCTAEFPEHSDDCAFHFTGHVDDAGCKHFGLYDLHGYNWAWDADTSTIWILDFAN